MNYVEKFSVIHLHTALPVIMEHVGYQPDMICRERSSSLRSSQYYYALYVRLTRTCAKYKDINDDIIRAIRGSARGAPAEPMIARSDCAAVHRSAAINQIARTRC